jgi:hypothetical protein
VLSVGTQDVGALRMLELSPELTESRMLSAGTQDVELSPELSESRVLSTGNAGSRRNAGRWSSRQSLLRAGCSLAL